MKLDFAVDSPANGSTYYRQRVPVEGWIFAHARHGELTRLSAHSCEPYCELGGTRRFFVRPDVTRAQRLPALTRTGFRFLASVRQPLPSSAAPVSIPFELHAEFADGTWHAFFGLTLQLFSRDYTDAPYGDLCNPQRSGILERQHLYARGRPADTASPECVQLLDDYLAPNASIIDVGCGIGAYCEPLEKLAHRWLGCEVSSDCLHTLAARGRPHRRIKLSRLPWLRSRSRLPAADREFDAAIAIEVLEHIREPDAFLAEIARVTRRQAFFSVPNCETLPFLSDRLVAPWHLLEGDHVNFFNRFNLCPLLEKHFRSVEILDYGRQHLASPEGLPLPYHLFAICEI